MVRVGDANPQLELGLVTQPGDLFARKTTPDSFLRTDLEALLTVRDVNHRYICGFASEFCVDTTVRCAAALGYPVTLVADAHTTHDKTHATAAQIRAHHNVTLPHIGSFGPVIQAIQADQIDFAGAARAAAVAL